MSQAAKRSDGVELESLVRKIQAGDSPEDHFQKIYEHYYPAFYGFFRKRGLSPAAAEDLAQDALFRVYTKMGEFRHEASFDTWLFHILGNIWKNDLRYRSAQKRQGQHLPIDDLVESDDEPRGFEPDDPAASPLEQVLADERTRALRQAVETLPPKMRRCFWLRAMQGLKYTEIATVMKISMATVQTQLSNARQRLRPMLERHFDLSEI